MKTADLPENAIRHMKAAALLALAAILLLLAGCGGGMVKTYEVQVSNITWTRAVPEICGVPGNYAGCASWVGKDCTITMPEDAPDWVVAHEFRHCFGYAHKE